MAGLLGLDPETSQRLSQALLGLGAGVAGGRNWREGIAGGLAGVAAGMQQARQNLRNDRLLNLQETTQTEETADRAARRKALEAQQAAIEAAAAQPPPNWTGTPEQWRTYVTANSDAAIGAGIKSVFDAPDAPKTREVRIGTQQVTQQWDPVSRSWTEVGRGPAWAPPTQINMPKPLPSLDERDDLLLRTGDPASVEYAQAYYRQYMTPKMVQTENGMLPIMPAIPPGIRKPGSGGSAAPNAGAVPSASPPAPDGGGGFTVGAPLPGTKPAEKPPTGDQALAAGFALRMERAEKLLDDIAKTGADSSSLWDAAKGYGGALGRSMQDPQYQRYMQAAQDWVRAKLRKESGAAIGETEMADEIAQYFPRPGDSQAVIEQKRASRATALDAMRMQTKGGAAGGGASSTGGAPSPTTQAEYDQIPAGSMYHHPDDPPGVLRRKQ